MNFDKTSNKAVMKGERFFFTIFFSLFLFSLFNFFLCNLLIPDDDDDDDGAERLRANKCKRVVKGEGEGGSRNPTM